MRVKRSPDAHDTHAGNQRARPWKVNVSRAATAWQSKLDTLESPRLRSRSLPVLASLRSTLVSTVSCARAPPSKPLLICPCVAPLWNLLRCYHVPFLEVQIRATTIVPPRSRFCFFATRRSYRATIDPSLLRIVLHIDYLIAVWSERSKKKGKRRGVVRLAALSRVLRNRRDRLE